MPSSASFPTTKPPTEEWTLAQWKDWVRDNADGYFGTIQIDARVLLAIVADLESTRDQVERVQKAWDEERQRL